MQPERLLIAVDPGKEGGVAFGWPPQIEKLATEPGDILDQLRAIPRNGQEVTVWLELVTGFVGKPQPGSAMFKFGRSVGMVETAITALNYSLVRVTPQSWQAGIKMRRQTNEKKDHYKRRLRAKACELMPALRPEITLQTCDAALMLFVAYDRNKPPSLEAVA